MTASALRSGRARAGQPAPEVDQPPRGQPSRGQPSRGQPESRIDGLLRAARAGLRRVGPLEAARLQADGALLVDIRPEADRLRHGEIPGALVVERNVLEWRLDPTSPDRLPEAVGEDVEIVVLCNAGYASSFAAASLTACGLRRVADLDGGFLAWALAGLPTRPARAAGS